MINKFHRFYEFIWKKYNNNDRERINDLLSINSKYFFFGKQGFKTYLEF